ncbi:MAG: BlaI/MecI/CopY family transcriptional regulator [Lysobacterales bacterium]
MLRFRSWALGELEVAVCNSLWDQGESDVRGMYELVGRQRGITSNTIQSAMERMYRKGVLRRRKVSHAYVYAPAMSRAEFAAGVLEGVSAALGQAGAQPLMAAFVERAGQADPATLDQLEALLRQARERREP